MKTIGFLCLGISMFWFGCGGTTTEQAATPAAESGPSGMQESPAVLRGLYPASTVAGRPFNVQRHGDAAIGVRCANARKSTKIVFGTQALATVYGSESHLTARVPTSLYAQPGKIPVLLRDERGESNSLEFTVARTPP